MTSSTVAQAHGRNWEKLCAAVPTKTRTQIKNYYQNYKSKLGLEHMLRPSSLPAASQQQSLPDDASSPGFPQPHQQTPPTELSHQQQQQQQLEEQQRLHQQLQQAQLQQEEAAMLKVSHSQNMSPCQHVDLRSS